jgi:hypothetical protein
MGCVCDGFALVLGLLRLLGKEWCLLSLFPQQYIFHVVVAQHPTRVTRGCQVLVLVLLWNLASSLLKQMVEA